MRPDDLKYTETHEWIKVNKKTKICVVGITDYAVKQLSDLVHIELPEAGDHIEVGQPFGEIESVKAVSDLFSPLTGEVTEVNEDVTGNLDVLSRDSFEEGWLLKVQVADFSELEDTMTRKEYDEFVLSEEGGGADEDEDEKAKKKAKVEVDEDEEDEDEEKDDDDEDEDEDDDD